MVSGRMLLGGCVGSAAVLAGSPAASETVTYSYDALGRLTASTVSGGPNGGVASAICMDAAGNRTTYVTTLSGGANCGGGSPPPPPPPPPPNNSPPVANADSLSAPKCVTRQVNVTANDTDPESNYPLQVTGTNQSWAYPVSASTIELVTPDTNGSYQVQYMVRDSLGATATGTLNVTVTGTQQCV